MKKISLAIVLITLSLGGTAIANVPDSIVKAVADTTRPKDDRDVDALRLPAETIAFAGVKRGMVVGELYPCGGYFSRMLSDVVGPKGKIYGLETTRWKGCLPADEKMAAEPGRANVTVGGFGFGEFTLPEKVDLFWITQNYHDLHIKDYGDVDMAAFNKHVFDSLKSGGVYFILDHQANPGTGEDQIKALHRIEKAQIIREVKAAGFRLVAEGDFLHRESDDHTKSIFDPSVKGHTDQYALKFVKP
ncbi:MAG: class I SAM-dependent methyltransferase [Proteobacteria bacterium]|nr:class I SAM-dependent methyltransferase [Pseudomonadota bacterium]